MRIEQKLIIPLLIISIGNTITCISKQLDMLSYFLYVGLFLMMIIPLSINKIKIPYNVFSLILLGFSLISISVNDPSVLNDIFLFTYSIHISKRSNKTYWIYGIIYSTVLISRYTFGGMAPSEIMVHLAGISFIFVIYQHYIHPKSEIFNTDSLTLKSYDSQKVKDDVVDIIQMRMGGYDWPEINDKLLLNINDSEVSRKVRNERNRLGFSNQDEFNMWLFKNGIISPISDKLKIQA
ncbi:hypothetical protein KAR91_16495 [Candidatus Pacearchaeota archaeon]|nr:hypothetical protein [Candidatus Pacearchaeota archaeon]